MKKCTQNILPFVMFLFAGILLLSGCSEKDDSEPEVKSSEKKILVFRFDQFTPPVTATIDESMKTITAVLPPEADPANLTPYIEISAKAAVSPASGSSLNFTTPLNFTVTAEDGSTVIYTTNVSVTASGPELLEGSMTANRTLVDRGPGIDYIVNDMLYLDGNALITIEPGVTIGFTGVSAGIVVGENAGLKMVGTATKPIILTGPVNNNNKGSWAGIVYYSNRADNLMDYVQLINGGHASSEAAISLNGNSSLRMTNSSIRGSSMYGIVMYYGKLPVFSNNVIDGCEDAPIWCGDINLLGTLGNTNTFTNNSKPYILVDNGMTIDNSLTIPNPGIPIRLDESVFVYKDLNLGEGVVLEFEYGMMMYVQNGGMLNAVGNSQYPVVFRGVLAEPGAWGGISIETSRNNRLEHCIVRDGGFDTYSTRANVTAWDGSKLSLNNVKLLKSAGYGFQFAGSVNLTHSSVVFEECALGNVYDYDNDMAYPNFP